MHLWERPGGVRRQQHEGASLSGSPDVARRMLPAGCARCARCACSGCGPSTLQQKVPMRGPSALVLPGAAAASCCARLPTTRSCGATSCRSAAPQMPPTLMCPRQRSMSSAAAGTSPPACLRTSEQGAAVTACTCPARQLQRQAARAYGWTLAERVLLHYFVPAILEMIHYAHPTFICCLLHRRDCPKTACRVCAGSNFWPDCTCAGAAVPTAMHCAHLHIFSTCIPHWRRNWRQLLGWR